MNFGKALELLKKGSKLRRKDWNNTKVCIIIVHNATYPQFDKTNGSKLSGVMTSFIAIKTTSEYAKPYVLCFEDIMAEDWEEVK